MENVILADFKIDFINDKRNYSKKKLGLKSELLSRALGAGRYGLRVLDLSAGLGIDAIFLSQMGYLVTALERNSVIYQKLNQAWQQLPEEVQKKIHFIQKEAKLFLETTQEDFDVIYFDPMFPEKKKSALPKKEMVIFRQLVGDDLDAEQVLAVALQNTSAHRVVVKRPLKAPWLLKKPNHQLLGKLVRFDIYGILK